MNNQQPPQQQQQFQQNMQVGSGSGLTRYRSAPSSYFASLVNSPTGDGGFGGDDFEQLFNPRASSPETQGILSRFMSSNDTITVQENFSSSNMTLPSQSQLNSQFLLPTVKNEPEVQRPQQQSNEMIYQSRNSSSSWGSFNSNPMKMERAGGSGGSTLIRHSSSPAGLFANINIENEFGAMRAVGNFGGGTSANAIGNFGENSSHDGYEFDENRDNDGNYIPDFPINSWDDSAILSDNFLNELPDNDSKRFSKANASDEQNNEGGNRPPTMLSHHLSLPKSSAELSAMEKMFQDSVPCKIRAKRGCATHPRSIAERVRRTKISERMRKLQELVPNMEKQTNTSDMLDLAVDYIKDLQKQVNTLADNREKCSCSAKQRS